MRYSLAFFALLFLAACVAPRTPAALDVAASQSSPMVGQMAPGFTLEDIENKKTSLADFRGKWVVLYFYGKEDTPGCQCGATEFTDLLKMLPKVHATVLAINDAPPEDNAYSRDKYLLEITMLSDVDAAIMGKYKIRGSVFDSIIHQTFLVDPAGRIMAHWPNVVAEGHVEAINARLKELSGK